MRPVIPHCPTCGEALDDDGECPTGCDQRTARDMEMIEWERRCETARELADERKREVGGTCTVTVRRPNVGITGRKERSR